MENNLVAVHGKPKPAFTALLTFLRAQLSAFTSGICDYLLMIFLTEVFGIYYTASIVISGIFGAVINYSINRHWTFNVTYVSKTTQLSRFVFVVMGSIAIKDAGTFLLTQYLLIDYRISKLIVDAFVSLGFNYTLQKYWVFKR